MIRVLNEVAVIVARFQVPELHSGHRHLIRHVQMIHRDSDVLIVLGDHGGLRTEHDPLTYEERAAMIREMFPEHRIRIDRLYDHPWSHERWSAQLDKLVEKHYRQRPAIMYGSRNSFLDVYTGKHRKQFVESVSEESGTDARSKIIYSSQMDARSAIIHAQQSRPPIMYSTVDIAVTGRDPVHWWPRVLLITKPSLDGLWAFPGGFVDPTCDKSDLDAAKRELSEEVQNVAVCGFEPLGLRIRVNDPRYRNSKDGVMTAFFQAHYDKGEPVAGDDAKDVRWFSERELDEAIVPFHKPLVPLLKQFWEREYPQPKYK